MIPAKRKLNFLPNIILTLINFRSSSNSFDHDSIGRSRNDSLEESSSNYPDYFSECVKKEAITPPSSIKNNNNTTHNNNNNETDGSSSILQLKTEPIGNPDSPESTSIDHPQPTTSADDCAGCGRLIQVKKKSQFKVHLFIWHASTPVAVGLCCAITDHLVSN